MVATRAQVEKTVTTKAKAHVNIGLGDCWENVHNALLIPAKFATAALGWEGAEFKHPWTGGAGDVPPLWAPVLWLGGSTIVDGKPAGHVAFYAGVVNGQHMAWSPGAPGSVADQSEWMLVSLTSIAIGWPGHTLVGWIEDVNGVRVPWLKPAPKPAPVVKPTVKTQPKPVTRGVHVDAALSSLKTAAKNAKPGTPRHAKITAAIDSLTAIEAKPKP